MLKIHGNILEDLGQLASGEKTKTKTLLTCYKFTVNLAHLTEVSTTNKALDHVFLLPVSLRGLNS